MIDGTIYRRLTEQESREAFLAADVELNFDALPAAAELINVMLDKTFAVNSLLLQSIGEPRQVRELPLEAGRFSVPNKYRLRAGSMGSGDDAGNNGAFLIPFLGVAFRVVASDQMGWEHVSVSVQHRCPTWDEMCAVKELFWTDDACVLQLHPPKKDYVNHHPFCLHLWRSTEHRFERPPTLMVGPRQPGPSLGNQP